MLQIKYTNSVFVQLEQSHKYSFFVQKDILCQEWDWSGLIKATLHAILTKLYIADARFADNLIKLPYCMLTLRPVVSKQAVNCQQLNCM